MSVYVCVSLLVCVLELWHTFQTLVFLYATESQMGQIAKSCFFISHSDCTLSLEYMSHL